jgi:hypothetical protein
MTLRIDLLQVQLAGKPKAKPVKSPAAIRTVTRLKHGACCEARTRTPLEGRPMKPPDDGDFQWHVVSPNSSADAAANRSRTGMRSSVGSTAVRSE